MISIILPTYKTPDALYLCVESIFKSKTTVPVEIVIICDGTRSLNQECLEKIESNTPKNFFIKTINFDTNYGMPMAVNHGVYQCSFDLIFLINDDNVFPIGWDKILLDALGNDKNLIITPNQIEPTPSMFKQCIERDFGTNPILFNLERWQKEEIHFRREEFDYSGYTFPLFMRKIDFMKVGGWDVSYPYQAVTDWDFILKLELCKIKFKRIYSCNFYHFVSLGTKNLDDINISQEKEMSSHQYFAYKWKEVAKHNSITNSKMLPTYERFI